MFVSSFKFLEVDNTDNTDKVCSNDKQGRVHKNVNFMTPWGMIKIIYMLMMQIEFNPFCKEVSIEYLLLVCPLRPMGLMFLFLFICLSCMKYNLVHVLDNDDENPTMYLLVFAKETIFDVPNNLFLHL